MKIYFQPLENITQEPGTLKKYNAYKLKSSHKLVVFMQIYFIFIF